MSNSSSLQDILDEFEHYLQSALNGEVIPQNLHDLPYRLMESVERLGGEIYEAVNAYGPPSLSSITLSIPPFLSSIPAVIAPAPPPPPPPPPATLIDKASHVLHTTGRVIARNKFKLIVGVVGLGILGGVVYDQRGLIGGYLYSLNARRKEKSEGGMRLGSVARRSRTGKKGRGKGGRVEEGMLKDAILILSPNPSPLLLIPLVQLLLSKDYIILLAVPTLALAEEIESTLRSFQSRSNINWMGALRVLIYDPEDSASLAPFQRSLWASLTLKFPAASQESGDARAGMSGSFHQSGDPYAPRPSDLARLHSIINLYGVHPAPSMSGGSALPAIPSLLRPPNTSTLNPSSDNHRRNLLPQLITFHYATSATPIPANFAEQLIGNGNLLLAKNMGVANPGILIKAVALGEVDYPSTASTASPAQKSAAQTHSRNSVEPGLARPLRVISLGIFSVGRFVSKEISNLLGGRASREWELVGGEIVRIVGKRKGGLYFLGRGSLIPHLLTKIFPPPILGLMLSHTSIASLLPIVPKYHDANNTHNNISASSSSNTISQPPFSESSGSVRPASTATSASHESEHEQTQEHPDSEAEEGGEQSRSSSAGSSSGLDGSWVGLEREAGS